VFDGPPKLGGPGGCRYGDFYGDFPIVELRNPAQMITVA